MSDKKLTSLRPHGIAFTVDPETGAMIEVETKQCCHCGLHWEVVPGSGKVRGYCMKCNGWFCGPHCCECVPIEKQLEIMEGTRNPTAVSVAGGMRLGVIGKIDG